MSDRGFINWKPRGDCVARLDMMLAVLEEYRQYQPLTGRQIFYRCVGQYGYEKDERAYKRLLYIGAKARRAGIIKFSSIRDDGVTIRRPRDWVGVDAFKADMVDIATRYRLERQFGQQRRLILLCEAAGMVPQMARIAHEFGVEVRSSGGYDSVTAKYDLASDIVGMGKPVTVLHIGDLDPSGEDIFTNIEEDVGAFVEELGRIDREHGSGHGGSMMVTRIAVTRQQAIDMDLPTAPPKSTDSRTKRFEGETVQAEAIPPNVLDSIVRKAITSRLDMEMYRRVLATEEEERRRIGRAIKELAFTEARP